MCETTFQIRYQWSKWVFLSKWLKLYEASGHLKHRKYWLWILKSHFSESLNAKGQQHLWSQSNISLEQSVFPEGVLMLADYWIFFPFNLNHHYHQQHNHHTRAHKHTHAHTYTRTHTHFLLQTLWSGCPLPVWSSSSAACGSWSVGCKCWTVIFINGTGWMSGALWGQDCALSRGGGSCRGEGECSCGKKRWGQHGKRHRAWLRAYSCPSSHSR